MKTLNFNVAAIAAFAASASKVRVRVGPDGAVQVRPTDRVSGARLPAGEALFEIERKKLPNGEYGLVQASTDVANGLVAGAAYALSAAKRGWVNLTAIDGAPEKGSAFVKVADAPAPAAAE